MCCWSHSLPYVARLFFMNPSHSSRFLGSDNAPNHGHKRLLAQAFGLVKPKHQAGLRRRSQAVVVVQYEFQLAFELVGVRSQQRHVVKKITMLLVSVLRFRLYARISPYIAGLWDLKAFVKNINKRRRTVNAARRVLELPMPARVILDFKSLRKIHPIALLATRDVQAAWEAACDFLGIECVYPGTSNRYATSLWRSNPELFWSHVRDLDDRTFLFLKASCVRSSTLLA